ncbi:hypothetical protein CCACVL1_24614 [Corchorus capsularis]|uniref:Uncharacterized protein n=1 Tax=Corchorus capsularis TaxID=210143 RepID=A0A1R3GNY4_COCAP|nr:hypothetical protein CCACVL1_24614 [Corchorus capsularis]
MSSVSRGTLTLTDLRRFDRLSDPVGP